MKVKIFGAGSIGNHLANASRRLGWAVDMVDPDPAALARTRDSIYPGRYQTWDDAIGLHDNASAPQGGYDLICIGTPPDSHLPLALQALAEKPKALLIEKPLCGPDMDGAEALLDAAEAAGVAVFVGYDHVVGRATRAMAAALTGTPALADVLTLDVEFREHWGGIFGAHPWLAGPQDSYLGYWRRGGGALGEHSHAINLWQHLAAVCGAGRVVKVTATLDFVRDGTVDYDRMALLTLETEHGLIGRVVQDVVTAPPRKWARVQAVNGFAEWHCGRQPGQDAVIVGAGGAPDEQAFDKTRPDDFIEELTHIDAALQAGTAAASPIALKRGLDTMMVVAAAHRSHLEKRAIAIDPDGGWRPDVLRPS